MADEVKPDRGAGDTEDAANEEQAFDGAFNEAAGAGERADLTAADDPENVKEEADEPPPPEEPEAEPKAAETPPQEPAAVEPDEKIEQKYKTLQGIHKHDKQTWEQEKADLLAQLDAAKKPKEEEKKPELTDEQKQKAADDFMDSLTDEQKEQLAQYEEDFDTVSKMEGLKRTRELAKLRKDMETWIGQLEAKLTTQRTEVEAQLAPAVKLAAEAEREAHFATIRQGYKKEDGTVIPGHADLKQYVDDGSLMAWIESKSSYLQKEMKRVYSKGSAEEVIELVTDFKRDNNITDTPPADNVVNIDAKKAERKAALTAVPSRRAAVNTGGKAAADDFDGAFDEAMKKSGG